MALLSPVLPLIGGGQTRFQPVYVGDVADALMAALTRPDAAGGTYELGGPAIYTFKQLLEYLLAVVRAPASRQRAWAAGRVAGAPAGAVAEPAADARPGAVAEAGQCGRGGGQGAPELGIEPTPIESVVPGYLRQYASRAAPACKTQSGQPR